MTNSLSTSYPAHQDDEVTAISEQDFLARVAAFERNEAQEAARAKESMKRMVAQQSKSKVKRRQCHRDNDHYKENYESDEDGQPPLFTLTGASPTAAAAGQPPPVNAIYPFYELAGRGPPPLQDPYKRDSLTLSSSSSSKRQREQQQNQDPYYGFTPPALIVKNPYHSHVYSSANAAAIRQDLTRGLTRGGDYKSKINASGYADGAGMHQHSSPDDPAFSLQFGYAHPSYRHPHYPSRQSSNEYDSSRPVSHHPPHPRSKSRQAPLPVPPRIHSALAPPTSLHDDGYSTNDNTQRNRERGPTFRFDYDLRTNPATLRVSSRANGGPFYIPTQSTSTPPLNHVHVSPTGAANHAFATPSNTNIITNNTNNTMKYQHHHHHSIHLRKSAFTPPQQRMTIICNLFPWVIDIQGSQSGFITVYDILSRVHEALHHPLTLNEWAHIPPTQQARIIHVWSRALSSGLGHAHAKTATQRHDVNVTASTENKLKLGWIERLGKYLVGRIIPSAHQHSSTTTTIQEPRDRDTLGLDIGIRPDGKRERRLEQGLLRIDYLAAQYPQKTSLYVQKKGLDMTGRDNDNGEGKSGEDSIKWIGLVRDDVLARARGFQEPGELQRCWSLLLG